jgi:hypothetical protein
MKTANTPTQQKEEWHKVVFKEHLGMVDKFTPIKYPKWQIYFHNEAFEIPFQI